MASGSPSARASSIDEAELREVLGHFPTGVVLVTAIASDDEPVGMILGSFTSVSLDPPIVGFLPANTSSTWRRLRTASRFCVNVLAADQTDICSRFSSKHATDKFRGVAWSPSPGGAPVIHGSIASIDCTVREIIDAGDHSIVLGDVTHLEVLEAKMPLLFFQGGFGRFSTHSLVLGSGAGIIEAVRSAEVARTDIEALAESLDVECSLLARSGDSSVVVAVATGPHVQPAAAIGARIPLMPPLGTLLIAHSSQEDIDDWLSRRHRLDVASENEYRSRLQVARERGWTVDTLSRYGEREFYQAIERFGDGAITPSQFRELSAVVSQFSSDLATFNLDPDRTYNIAGVMTAVFDGSPKTPFVLRMSQLPADAPADQVRKWIDRVTEVGQRISQRLGASLQPR